MTISESARMYCDMANSCSECPVQSNVRECLVHAIAESKVDPMAVIQFLARFAAMPQPIEAEGTVV